MPIELVDVQARVRAGLGEAVAIAGHAVGEGEGFDVQVVAPPFAQALGGMEVQLERQPGPGEAQRGSDPLLDAVRSDDLQRLLSALHAGAGQQAGQAVAVVAMDMGNEYRTQLMQRKRRAQHLVLRSLAGAILYRSPPTAPAR